ncbi:hypothetical protein DRO54_06295 [Candidatus Bathyarchaeota archaeon]|nr:MAG: hypothetical protein DRO54_06295 [Candidatus Bathyarchaeota archaeon]
MHLVVMQLLAGGSQNQFRNLLNELIKAIGLGFTILIAIAIFVIQVLILSVVIYIAGLMVVGGRRATFGDAFKISLLGTVLGGLIYAAISFFVPLVGLIVYILVWLALIKQYFETGWLNALAIGILAIIVALVLLIIVALILAIPLTLLELFKGTMGFFIIFM